MKKRISRMMNAVNAMKVARSVCGLRPPRREAVACCLAMLAGCSASPQRGEMQAQAAKAPSVPMYEPASAQEEGVLLVVNEKGHEARSVSGKIWLSPKTLSHQQGGGCADEFEGPVARTGMEQRFFNPADHPVDDDWWLPIPSDATVMDLIVDVGSRHFRAVMVEAEQAKALYASAQKQGKHAAILRVSDLGWHLFLSQVPSKSVVVTCVTYAQMRADAATMKTFVARHNGTEFWVNKGEIIRFQVKDIPDTNLTAFPTIRALYASREINRLLALDRATGRPDHAKQACDLAREAKIVSPVSSLLMVDAKGEKK